MTKLFCDICEKEISSKYDYCKLIADSSKKLIYCSNEVCMECIEKINDYITTLKPKKDGD